VCSDLKQDILDSIEDVDDLLTTYALLFDSVKQSEPDKVELAALGTVLHSFYNGVEGIFLYVSKQVDNDTPSDSAWHQSLLSRITEPTGDRTHLITPDTAAVLAPYLKFRHFFRHSYAFMLDWKRMKPLVDELNTTWNVAKADILSFCDSIS